MLILIVACCLGASPRTNSDFVCCGQTAVASNMIIPTPSTNPRFLMIAPSVLLVMQMLITYPDAICISLQTVVKLFARLRATRRGARYMPCKNAGVSRSNDLVVCGFMYDWRNVATAAYTLGSYWHTS